MTTYFKAGVEVTEQEFYSDVAEDGTVVTRDMVMEGLAGLSREEKQQVWDGNYANFAQMWGLINKVIAKRDIQRTI